VVSTGARRVEIVLSDSVTMLDGRAAGAVVVTGSHGGRYSAYLAERRGTRAAVFNDAGGGKDGAGIAGLDRLGAAGIPAVAVGHDTARIGDAADMMANGLVRHVNAPARGLGCAEGLTCGQAAGMLREAPWLRGDPEPYREARQLIAAGTTQIWALDSASLAGPEDAGRILLTGSHGGLLGGRPATALNADAVAAVYNDAGIGKDAAGLSRLAVLDERGIAAATVAADSARIGDGLSTFEDGVISAANATAAARGVRIGMTAREFVALLVAS
jgi:hypothetical protein